MKICTFDGSFTLYDELFDECYHSVSDGALNETLQKHVIPAFNAVAGGKKEINILDICFGLGFNSLATIWYAKNNYPGLKINIFSPEMNLALVQSLRTFEYPEQLLQDGIVDALALSQYYADEDYSVEVAIGDAREILKQKEASFDIVYQDAFSPKKNPELWTIEYFSDIKRLLAKEAVITTYSKATPVRLALYELGFNLYEHPRGSVRGGTIASNFDTKGLQKVDMLTKIKNAPNSRALRDQDKG
ncbi:MAG: hypothetical protein JHC37_01030 [Campylobacteraceae bacterium]|jgi:tRNA U34 5-methylaminomethyl-2-thiouridine-forming methyltransferase MnmC|nr:hypothetical protein [Campylobacteraceae bacterium]